MRKINKIFTRPFLRGLQNIKLSSIIKKLKFKTRTAEVGFRTPSYLFSGLVSLATAELQKPNILISADMDAVYVTHKSTSELREDSKRTKH